MGSELVSKNHYKNCESQPYKGISRIYMDTYKIGNWVHSFDTIVLAIAF